LGAKAHSGSWIISLPQSGHSLADTPTVRRAFEWHPGLRPFQTLEIRAGTQANRQSIRTAFGAGGGLRDSLWDLMGSVVAEGATVDLFARRA